MIMIIVIMIIIIIIIIWPLSFLSLFNHYVFLFNTDF